MAEDLEYKSGRRKRWDYIRTQCEAHNIKTSDEPIAQLGREGWELVDIVYTQSYVHFWFKREVV